MIISNNYVLILVQIFNQKMEYVPESDAYIKTMCRRPHRNNNPYVPLCGLFHTDLWADNTLTHAALCYNYYRILRI